MNATITDAMIDNVVIDGGDDFLNDFTGELISLRPTGKFKLNLELQKNLFDLFCTIERSSEISRRSINFSSSV